MRAAKPRDARNEGLSHLAPSVTRVAVCVSKPIFVVVVVVVVVFDFLVAVASSDLKVLITYYKCTCQCCWKSISGFQ